MVDTLRADQQNPGNVTIGSGQGSRIVVVAPPALDLHTDLGEKLYEIRCKRDAISLHHESLKKQNDSFNKTIIILSLCTAFVETLKSTLRLTDETVHGTNVASAAKIAPIAISTLTAVVSSLMKFRKYPERMETLTKASEKFNHTATRMRRLQEELSFVDEASAKKMYIDEVMEFYRESLQEAEATIYPDVRQKYFKRAQDNIVKMQKNEKSFLKTCRKLNAEMEDLRNTPYAAQRAVDLQQASNVSEPDAESIDISSDSGDDKTEDSPAAPTKKSWIKQTETV